MDESLREAQRHAEKIKDFYDNAGNKGYSQAMHHWSELTKITRNAPENDKPVINSIRLEMRKLMEEMKERE